MSFIRKKDALDYFKSNGVKKPCLFSEDINVSGSKRFHVTSSRNIFDNMLTNENNHYYEFWTADQSLVFGLDLDIKKVDDIDGEKIVKQVIKNVINGAKKYYHHTYEPKDFIVLENSPIHQEEESPDKISYHIICRGLTFENHLVTKDFYMRLNKDYKMDHCDSSIYNVTCFRLCFSSKKGKKAMALPVKFTIDGMNTVFPERSSKKSMYKFWLRTLLTYIDDDDPIITKKHISHKNSVTLIDNNQDDTNIDAKKLEDMIFQLPANYYDDRETWIKMGIILKNTGEFFDLWNRWSKQSTKYDNAVMQKTWESFKTDGRIKIGTLIHWCNESNVTNMLNSKRSLKDNIISYPEKPIQLDSSSKIILNQAKLEPSIYEPYINKRMIAVQSEKGTGKTTNLLKSLFTSGTVTKDTSILFVSSRRTFGIKLLGDLKDKKFKLYSNVKEHYITNPRIICQVDSLMRLDRIKYDIVVIDEAESLARYLTSSHFTKNPHSSLTVSTLKMRVKEADHIYVLDADLSIRCLNFYKNVLQLKEDEYQLIVNEYKPYEEYTFVSMSYDQWLVSIIRDVSNNKRLVIPMASNTKAKDLYTKITNDYPNKNVLLIHKETSDEDKLEKLVNVNNTWKNYDIIIYTPSVCMGVSFDISGHFDKIYAYGCHMSLGAQEFCQMIHRVRDPKDKKIYISMDYYKEFNKTEDFLSYEEVEEMMCSDYYLTHFDVHNNLVVKEASHIVHMDGEVQRRRDVVLQYPYKNDPVYDLYVRNVWEMIENKLNFSASFYGYAKHKGYKMEFQKEDVDKALVNEMKSIKDKRVEEQKMKNNTGIIEAKDITREEYNQLIKMRSEYLTEQNVHEIHRYNLKKCYAVDAANITEEFVEIYNDQSKMKQYRNISTIIKTDTISTDSKLGLLKKSRQTNLSLTNCYLDFTVKNQYAHHYYALSILKYAGVDINNLEVEISDDNMQEALENIVKWAENYKKDIALKFDLNIRNKTLVDMNRTSRIKLANNIIESMYGIKFKKDKTMYKIMGNEIWDNLPREVKVIAIEMYNLDEVELKDMFGDDEVNFMALDEGIEI